MDDDNHILRPFDASEAVRVNVAAMIAGVAPRTVQAWAAEHGIGRRVGGQWRISRVALQMWLDDDRAALRAYRRGDRVSERVLRYFRIAGLKSPQNPQAPQGKSGD